jgi:hypothetical protein
VFLDGFLIFFVVLYLFAGINVQSGEEVAVKLVGFTSLAIICNSFL